jgi:predicted nucleic acid-binding protein
MSAKAFIDSNVILYLLSADTGKANQAEAVINENCVISVQVLNEVTNIARKKLGLSWPQIAGFLELVRSICRVEPLTIETHDRARIVAQRYKLSFYDAVIIASALIAGCDRLHTEDMHNKRVIDGTLTIHDPFAT